MFDLITGKATHIPHTPGVPLLASLTAQLAVLGALVVVPLLWVTDQLPAPQTMMAFVAALPPPPPPPPPPPAPLPERARAPEQPVATSSPAAPVDAPVGIKPEPPIDSGEEGIPGGVVGGVPGGIIAGVVGGLDAAPPPPPPPPPPPRITRVGGDIKAPALLKRVEPVYPPLAVAANIEATVILDAIVDEEGEVTAVKVLRSGGVLDKAAVDAVLQWLYAPLMLNGRPASFQLTVVLSFRLQR